MNENEQILQIIDRLKQGVLDTRSLQNKQKRLCRQFDRLQRQYSRLDIPEDMQEIHNSLISKGERLADTRFRPGADPKLLNESLLSYISYLDAAYGDFTGQLDKLTAYHRLYLFCAILVMLLSPFVISPLFALLMLIPIFLAARGLRQRSRLGFVLSLAVGAAGIITASFWLKYMVYILFDYNGMLRDFMSVNTFLPPTLAEALMILLPALGTVLLALTFWLLYKAWAVRRLFV